MPLMPTPSPIARRPAGFTLVELLVVIGIIAILVGLLVPVVSRVRQSARVADTQNLMTQISSGIDRYYMDHNAYPGPLDQNLATTIYESNLAGTASTGTQMTPQPTMTENLALALLGGLKFDAAANRFYFVLNELEQSKGPMSLNPRAPKRFAPYMTLKTGILSPGRMDKADWQYAKPTMIDSVVPEFIDSIGEGMPILYMRARTGAPGIISNFGAPGNYQYDIAYLAPYLRPGVDGLIGADRTAFNLGGYDDLVTDKRAENALAYTKHPTLVPSDPANPNATGTPKNKDRYILISAGKDGIYGTEDDVQVGGR